MEKTLDLSELTYPQLRRLKFVLDKAVADARALNSRLPSMDQLRAEDYRHGLREQAKERIEILGKVTVSLEKLLSELPEPSAPP